MKKIKKIFRLLGINLLVLVILLLAVEVVLRIAGIGYSNSPADSDPVLNWVHPKDYQYTMYTPSGEFGGFEVYFDSLGRRSHLPGKATNSKYGQPIVFLGDSFTEALQVPYGSSFIGILDNNFKKTPFLNYGTTGYSPVYYYLQCRQIINEHKLKPTAVVMVLYSNDVRDDSAILYRAVYDSANENIIAINGGKKNSLKAFFRNLYLARIARKTYLKWQYARKNKKKNVPAINGLVEETQAIDSTLTEEYILKTVTLLKNHSIPCYITAIPSKYINFKKDSSIISFAQKAELWSKEKQIPFINLHNSFDSISLHSGQQLFFSTDIHCNNNGHRVIAREIAFTIDSLITHK